MSYTALYRKWRPTEFSDVKGQEHIITTLQNQIKADRIGHAYLFCGTRGTGKTTVAKIFARAVNCAQPKDGSPCGECAVCRSIAAGTSMNVIEIDAASNNGVEDIRKIREEVQYAPTEGRYKVYIIDEVHMLSIGAFNALLKTLEEPPAYVIFILATTETHKIPVTILSRCQRYDFKRISIRTITDRLQELTQAEGVSVAEKALTYIAKAADGSMRDALSLLDQCIAFYLGKALTYDDVLEVLGAVDTQVFSDMLRKVLADDTVGVLRMIDGLIMQGRDLGQFVTDFIWYLRNLLLVKTSDNAEEVVDMSSDNMALLKEESKVIDENTLMRYIRIFSTLSNDIKYSSQKRVLLEIAMIKLTKPAMEQSTDLGDVISRITRLEERMDQGLLVQYTEEDAVQTNAVNAANGGAADTDRISGVKRHIIDALPEEMENIARQWQTITNAVAEPYLCNALAMSMVTLTEDKKSLLIITSSETVQRAFEKEENQKLLSDAVENVTGRHVNIVYQYNGNADEVAYAYNDVRSMVRMPIVNDDNEEEIL